MHYKLFNSSYFIELKYLIGIGSSILNEIKMIQYRYIIGNMYDALFFNNIVS